MASSSLPAFLDPRLMVPWGLYFLIILAFWLYGRWYDREWWADRKQYDVADQFFAGRAVPTLLWTGVVLVLYSLGYLVPRSRIVFAWWIGISVVAALSAWFPGRKDTSEKPLLWLVVILAGISGALIAFWATAILLLQPLPYDIPHS